MNPNKRQKLKKLLEALSTTEERRDLQKMDKLYDIKNEVKRSTAMGEVSTGEIREVKAGIQTLGEKISSIKIPKTDFSPVVEALGEINRAVSRPYPQPPNLVDYSPTYKSILASLGEVNKSIRDKPVPVWQWPQYAGVNVRDRSFAQINPKTDGIGVGSYDYVARVLTSATTETYTFRTGGSSGTVVATIVIVYTDSTLAAISTVTKTPITLQ